MATPGSGDRVAKRDLQQGSSAEAGLSTPSKLAVLVAIAAVAIAVNSVTRPTGRVIDGPGHAARLPYSPIMKVFVYDVPEELYGVAMKKCSRSDMYATEILIPEMMAKHKPIQVQNPDLASYFLIPHRSTCLYHDCFFNKGLSTSECKSRGAEAMKNIVDHISNKWPYWNETLGINHLLVFSWDQASEVLGYHTEPIRQRIHNTIHITTLGWVGYHPNFHVHKDIVIPPFLNFTYWQANNAKFAGHDNRPMKAYFRGTIFEDKKYSHGTRQKLQAMSKEDPDLFVKVGAVDWYPEELGKAEFSMSPLGWSPWSPRFFEGLAMGAVPVIISDGILMPFEEQFNYRAFSVKVAQENVSSIMDTLRGFSPEEIAVKRKVGGNVWRRLFFHEPSQVNDAFYNLLSELARKRSRHAPIAYSTY